MYPPVSPTAIPVPMSATPASPIEPASSQLNPEGEQESACAALERPVPDTRDMTSCMESCASALWSASWSAAKALEDEEVVAGVDNAACCCNACTYDDTAGALLGVDAGCGDNACCCRACTYADATGTGTVLGAGEGAGCGDVVVV